MRQQRLATEKIPFDDDDRSVLDGYRREPSWFRIREPTSRRRIGGAPTIRAAGMKTL